MTEPTRKEPLALPGPSRPRREEFFIHPDILTGDAGYRTVSRRRASTDADNSATRLR